MYAIINGKIVMSDKIVKDKVLIFDKTIREISDDIPKDLINKVKIIDAKDNYVSPGFIDIHIHGNVGYDFMDANLEQIEKIEKSIASKGVTSYLATTMTMSQEKIYNALETLKIKKNLNTAGAKMLGVHLEGPFLSEKYKGAQDPNFIIPPSYDFIKDYVDIIKIITYAPEQDINFEFTKYITENTDIILSMGHTDASYEKACEAIQRGAKHATHLFNAMTGLNHRDPGVVGATLLNENVKCELIADTIHFKKDLLEFIVRLKKLEDILLITDAMEATNMPDGIYSIGGHPVKVENNCARLVSNNALAGSVLNLNQAVKNVFENTSLSLPQVISLASANPAKALGIYSQKGSIDVNKDADIIIFDKELNCLMTIVEGHIKYKKELV